MEKNSANPLLENIDMEMIAKVKEVFKKSLNERECQKWKGHTFMPAFSVNMAEYTYNEFEPRKEDVFVVSYPKTGTNWTHEVVRQILYPDEKENQLTKSLSIAFGLLEVEPKEKFEILDKLPLKRRLFGSHLPASLVNVEKIKKANAKVVYVLRNPKDQMVSWYNFAPKLPMSQHEPLKSMLLQGWDKFFDHCVAGDFPMINKPGEWYPDHVLSWYPHLDNKTVYFLYYENMKKDFCKEIKGLAEFLDVSLSEERAQDIANACSFDAMKKDQTSGNGMMSRMAGMVMRKGGVGGWKDYFTVRQSEKVDEVFAEKMKDIDIDFTYLL